jgi:hypothetical protein
LAQCADGTLSLDKPDHLRHCIRRRNRDQHDAPHREVFPLLRLYRGFGNFSELNFSQVGHGIGYYDAGTAERSAGVVGAKLGDP